MDAFREALESDPLLSQSKAGYLGAFEGVSQARASLLPQIRAATSINQANGGTPQSTAGLHSSSRRSRDTSLSMNQPAIDPGKWADLSAAKSQANSQEASYRAALQKLYVRTATAYFGVLTNTDRLSYAKSNESALRQAYEHADRRFKAGLSAITDAHRAKSMYEQARAQTIQANNALDNAKEALTQITGKPTRSLKKLREEFPMEPPSPANPHAWVQLALKNNPVIAAKQFHVELAEDKVHSASAGHLPVVSTSLTHRKAKSWAESHIRPSVPDSNAGERQATNLGITLTMPIFSGGATQSQVRQSIYNRDSAQDALESQRRQVTRDTLNFYRTAVAGITQVEAAKAGVDSGQKALEATRAGFDVGTQTMLNVLTAIQTLTQAQSTYSQSRHQFVLNKLQLKEEAGTIDMKDMEEINALLQ